jgi:putative hydrolase of the HAD superfamily
MSGARPSMRLVAYQGLILDFGGVITTDFHGCLSAFCVREGLAPDAVTRALSVIPEGRDTFAAVEAGRVPQRELELMLARQLGLSDQDLIARMLADLRPRPEAADLVKSARAAGAATAVLSNSWGIGGYDPYGGYDLAALFDVVVISDQVGLRKPEPAIYDLTATKLGLRPEDCVFVDDTPANLVTARHLGMTAVHFTGAPSDFAEIERLIGIESLCRVRPANWGLTRHDDVAARVLAPGMPEVPDLPGASIGDQQEPLDHHEVREETDG